MTVYWTLQYTSISRKAWSRWIGYVREQTRIRPQMSTGQTVRNKQTNSILLRIIVWTTKRLFTGYVPCSTCCEISYRKSREAIRQNNCVSIIYKIVCTYFSRLMQRLGEEFRINLKQLHEILIMKQPKKA